MRNVGLDEAQAGTQIARRNINNLRYTNDTTLIAESEEELKSLLIKVKEESERAGLKLNIQKTMIMASSPITSWQTKRGKVENSDTFSLLGIQNICSKAYICMYIWRRAWQLTPLFSPGESHRQRILTGHSPWGFKKSDVTEVTQYTFTHECVCVCVCLYVIHIPYILCS